jgi:hypothetical protein
VTPVHAVKVADGQGAGSSQIRVMKSAENLHVAWVLARLAGVAPTATVLSK